MEFYQAYGLTDQAVWEVEDGIDAVSTATESKFTQADGLAKGTYNNGKYIMGVKIPVAVDAEAYKTLEGDKKYSFTDLDTVPEVYSTLSITDGKYSFSQFQEATIDKSYLKVKDLDLNGGYGDYEVMLGGFNTSASDGHPKGIQTGENSAIEKYTIYGAYLTTAAGGKYGMTTLENLWFGTSHPEIAVAWSVKGGQGLKRGHGKGDAFYQFDLNGKTITGMTVITSIGVIDVPCENGSIELPAYYAGDTSSLTYSATGGSKEVSISGLPSDFGTNPTATVSYKSRKTNVYLAKDAQISDGKVVLDEEIQDGTSYTLIINGNGNAIIRGLASSISEDQKTELLDLIEQAKAATGYDTNQDLQEHVKEAEEMIENPAVESTVAASLIDELKAKIKKTYPILVISEAKIRGQVLDIELQDVKFNELKNAVYTLTYGTGKSTKTFVSGALSSTSIQLSETPEVGTTYTLKITSDNYQDGSAEVKAEAVTALNSTSVGGVIYFYADTENEAEDATYQASIKKGKGASATTTFYHYKKGDLTSIDGSSICYIVAAGSTELSGELYGYGEGTETTYKEVYSNLGIETDASYDVISSATKYTSHHAGDIPSLVLFGTDANGDKAITGLNLGRAQKKVDAKAYVEASILSAAGVELTGDQKEIIEVPLKVNPMEAPAKDIKPVAEKVEYALSKYGVGEFKITPKAIEGFVLKEYWSNVFAATVSNGTVTVGAVHWVDLYGEAGHDNLELELNNGKALATNEQEVNRYAAFFDESGCLKAGTYTITLYAEGYEDFKVSVEVTAEKAQAYAANALIKALSQNEYSTAAEAQAAVDAAKAAFQNLTVDQKELLKVKEDDITKAQAAATAQKEAEDKAAVEQVKTLINKANEKYASSDKAQAAVNAAKAAFQNLTEDQKALLGKEEIKELENALNKAQTAATAQKTAEVNAAKQKNENKTDNKKQTVTKQSQSLKKLTPATKKLKASKLKKKKQTFKLKAKINGKGKVTFKKVSGNKKITISKAGRVTVKKGLKKGTYKVKVKVSIAATGNYKAASATKTIKIKVK
ncbi:MAG: hypothetical protein IJI10_03540 [Eubacterium sp.]|nr:hypothetical protein [Eubacterium sp.]